MDIEMPGQYMSGEEPAPDSIVFLESISSNVHVSFFLICCKGSTVVSYGVLVLQLIDSSAVCVCLCLVIWGIEPSMQKQ